jgi:hypothetical protein
MYVLSRCITGLTDSPARNNCGTNAAPAKARPADFTRSRRFTPGKFDFDFDLPEQIEDSRTNVSRLSEIKIRRECKTSKSF